MAKRLDAGVVGGGVLALCIVVLSGTARAAGEWEWTAGQGWVQGAGVSRPTAREQLAHAYQLEQRGEFMDAARQYFLLIQNFPDSEEAGVGLQRLAKCLFEMENFYTSYQAIEQVIKTYPNTGRMSDLIEIELRIAKKMLMSNAATTVFEQDANARQTNIRRALEVVNQVLEHDPWGPVAAEAYIVKGEAHMYIGEIAAARAAFEHVQNDFPRSQHVERARLGVIRCDSLVGQASSQELKEQYDLYREIEEERRKDGGAGPVDEFDDLDETTRQLADIEAGKMMDQAAQYKRMGTHQAVKAADFLYKEVIRRYPHSPQAQEARETLGIMKIPEEEGRMRRAIRSINWNPFNWNKEPEPPWITPQLSAEDAVIVDTGIGPIAGVPETAFPLDPGAAGVRPAAFDDPNLQTNYDGDLASLPGFGDGRDRAGGPPQRPIQGPPAGFAEPVYGAPGPPAYRQPAAPNPLPSIPDSDLVGVPGAAPVSVASQSYYSPAAPVQTPPPVAGYYEPHPSATPLPDIAPAGRPSDPPRLGVMPGDDMSDLIGPTRRMDSGQAPLPYGLDPVPAGQAYYQQQYAAPDTYQAPQTYATTQTYSAPPATGGGWTMDSDLW
ncbi:MAG: tetratricopeptide repeat protein [Planctomycetota bacterium]|jgi:TolA-binding protein|nr:tetratricopeptide repeat protein [Planctomycetota bacterium]